MSIDTTALASLPVLRPMGAFEQVFHWYMHRNPVHVTITGHVAARVDPASLRSALARLQQVHPLLASSVDDDDPVTGAGPVYRRSSLPVGLIVTEAGTAWQEVVASEQNRLFDTAVGPVWRAALIPGFRENRETVALDTLVLTFDHRIADGMAAWRVLSALVVLLTGGDLTEQHLPGAQDDMVLAGAPDGDRGDEPGDPAQADERLTAPGSVRPFDGTPAEVTSAVLNPDVVRVLVLTCRANGVTVQAALSAAVTRVLQRSGRDYVRIITPMDLRRLSNLPDDVAIRIMPARTGSSPDPSEGFWNAARESADQLAPLRNPEAVVRATRALKAAVPHNADGGDAVMLAIGSLDAMITNLGVLTVPATTGTVLVSVEGIAMSSRFAGEQIVGVTTVAGAMHLTNTTHDPVPRFVQDVAAELQQAAEAA